MEHRLPADMVPLGKLYRRRNLMVWYHEGRASYSMEVEAYGKPDPRWKWKRPFVIARWQIRFN